MKGKGNGPSFFMRIPVQKNYAAMRRTRLFIIYLFYINKIFIFVIDKI